jgi:methyl-accepting chemotaxis protein
VNTAIAQMDEVTQQNAALVEEAAAAAESMEEQAGKLASAVAQFLLERGSSNLNSEFDFAKAVQAHLDWKRKLHEAIEGRGDPIDAAVVSCDDRCALGQWIYGAGGRFAKYAEHGSLRSSHADFHRCAGNVARLAQAGRKGEAEQILNTEFHEASRETIVRMRALQNLTQRNPAHSGEQTNAAAAKVTAFNRGTAPTAAKRAMPAQHPVSGATTSRASGGADEWTEF